MEKRGGIRHRQRGAIGIEYAGMIVVAAFVVAAITIGLTTAGLADKVGVAICKIITLGAGECGGEDGEIGSEGKRPEYGGPWADGEDPGDDVEYPDGLDPNSQAARDLASTPRGRRILQWLKDNGIRVNVDPTRKGAYYEQRWMFRGPTITLGKDQDTASTLAHEAEHARWDVADLNPDPKKTTREEFIRISIREDAEGSWLAVITNKERRASGQVVKVTSAEANYDAAYKAAYERAIAAGQSPAAAHNAANAAGLDRIELMYYNGEFVQSTDQRSYPDKWGEVWDKAQ